MPASCSQPAKEPYSPCRTGQKSLYSHTLLAFERVRRPWGQLVCNLRFWGKSLPRKRMPALRASASSRTRLSTWQATSAVFRLTCRSENTTHDWTPCQCVPAGTSACKLIWGRLLRWPDALSACSSEGSGADCFLGRLLLLAVSRSAAGCSEAPLLSAGAAQSLPAALRSGAGFFLGRPGLLTGLDSAVGCSTGSSPASGLAAAASEAFFLAQTLTFLRLGDEIWWVAGRPGLLVSTGLPR